MFLLIEVKGTEEIKYVCIRCEPQKSDLAPRPLKIYKKSNKCKVKIGTT
jgi:hypothetical protein